MIQIIIAGQETTNISRQISDAFNKFGDAKPEEIIPSVNEMFAQFSHKLPFEEFELIEFCNKLEKEGKNIIRLREDPEDSTVPEMLFLAPKKN